MISEPMAAYICSYKEKGQQKTNRNALISMWVCKLGSKIGFISISFFFYTSNLQGLTVPWYKNKNFKNASTKQDSNIEKIQYISQEVVKTWRRHKYT